VSRLVLGVDPGTAVTGYGVVEAEPGRPGRLVECGVLRTDARTDLAQRLATLHEGMGDLLRQHHPDVVAVEGIFYAKNVRTTLVLSHARGVILLAAAQAGVPVAEFAPAAVKKAVVGRGRATKAQVGFMVQQLLRLRQAPRPPDAADGVAIALAYVLTARSP
jgi:crossover junction endodeoxyribonuclease RuvC